jgi:sarcosine oxidase
MATHYKYIVIGAGMMGSAAARHLAGLSDGVALIGPAEPKNPASHQGVFGSHYDEGRITRTIDPDPVWALLANRSIARYGDIARDSGVDFYSEVGCLLTGPARDGQPSYVGDVLSAVARLEVETQILDEAALQQQFPYFSFGAGSEGVFEPQNAGHINPRRLVKAQIALAEKAGATIIRQTVILVREEGGLVSVATAEGEVFTAEKVLVAAGGFSIAKNLLPQPIDLSVFARTVAFFEIGEPEAERLAGMPSLIARMPEATDDFYLLPPIRYPDGKIYLKIGGDPDDVRLESDAEIRAWFRSGGRESARLHLTRQMQRLMPELLAESQPMAACVVAFTPTGYPAIGFSSSPNIAVVTGGCGAAAKSSDEIGRLGAMLLLEGAIHDPAFGAQFMPVFA